MSTETTTRRVGSREPVFLKSEQDKSTQYRMSVNEVLTFAKLIKVTFILWQLDLVMAMLATREDIVVDGSSRKRVQSWLHKIVGYLVPRQNGKTFVVIFRMLFGAVMLKERFIYTAHSNELITSVFDDLENMIKNSPYLQKHIPLSNIKNNGKAGIVIETIADSEGRRGVIYLATRNHGNSNPGRGKAVDIVFYDEAHLVLPNHVKSLGAVTATKTWKQSIYLGTPPDPNVEAVGEWFLKFRDNMKNSTAKGIYWAEWTTNEITDSFDREAWFRTNPSLNVPRDDGNGLTEDAMETAAVELSDDRAFAIERLGFIQDKTKSDLIHYSAWRRARDIGFKKEISPTEKIAVAIKVDKHETIAAVSIASADLDRSTFVDTLFLSTDKTTWAEEIANILHSPEPGVPSIIRSKKCVGILLDGYHSTESILSVLSKRGLWDMDSGANKQGKIEHIKVRSLTSSVPAFVNAVNSGNIIHRSPDGSNMSKCVRVADKRKVTRAEEGYGFSSIDGLTHMELLEAAALAFAKAEAVSTTQYGKLSLEKNRGSRLRIEGIGNGRARSIF